MNLILDKTGEIPLYAQYGEAECLQRFINKLVPNCIIDREQFYNDKFNLLTCDGEGLDFWGELLGQPRSIYSPYISNIIGYAPTPVNLKYPEQTSIRPFNQLTRSYDGIGTYYNNQVVKTDFTDAEYRIVLINAFILQYTACTLGNLIDYLYYFFNFANRTQIKSLYQAEYQVLESKYYNPNYDMKWRVDVVNLANGYEKWVIYYDKPFVEAPDKQNWLLLFSQHVGYGGSRIMPIPIDVQWELKQG